MRIFRGIQSRLDKWKKDILKNPLPRYMRGLSIFITNYCLFRDNRGNTATADFWFDKIFPHSPKIKHKKSYEYGYNFKEDQKRGREMEKIAARILKQRFDEFRNAELVHPDGKESRFDFYFKSQVSFEVKDDNATYESGRVGIEFRDRHGNPSGIDVTESEWWIHIINGLFYMTRVSMIRDMIDNEEYSCITYGGGDDYGDGKKLSAMYLIDKGKFKKKCRCLDADLD